MRLVVEHEVIDVDPAGTQRADDRVGLSPDDTDIVGALHDHVRRADLVDATDRRTGKHVRLLLRSAGLPT